MKEALIYSIVALSSLTVLGYTVHMFIGGLVEPETEKTAIIVAVIVGAIVIGFMAWDVIKRRLGQ